MAKLENNLLNMFLSLTVICVVVGGLLGFVASITKQPIQDAKDAAQKAAIAAVAPEFDAVAAPEMVAQANGETATVFAVSKDGQVVGHAVQVTTLKGFGGKVIVMFGFDLEGNITGYNVLDCSNETPGLGAKMPDWFQKGAKGDVIGKNPSKNNLTVTKDGGEVDAITAATISSRAFCDAIAQAAGILTGTDVVTSASTQVNAPVQSAAEPVEEAEAEEEAAKEIGVAGSIN